VKNDRRKFIKLSGMAGFALGSGALRSSGLENFSAEQAEDIRFLFPVDGDMLNEYDGSVSDGKLAIKVRIEAPAGSKIKVNGAVAEYVNGIFQADVKLAAYENIIELTESKKGFRESIRIFWMKNYAGKYRFSFDDNIWFLQDISGNAGRYRSIFDNQYLGFLKKVHDIYGTKIHLNIYYQTDGFNLSMMTDKFRNEWRENAGWLGLSFHALANDPDKPYISAGYGQVKDDCTLVKEQIRRFAGEEVMGPETTLHWGESTVDGCRALRDSGYTVLAGYFNVDDSQAPVSYYLNEEQRRNIKKRFIWRDNREGIIFSRIALVVNTVKIDQIVPYLDNVKKTFNPRYVDLMIHEQYFYPHYVAYQPDWREKVTTAVKWAVESGYKPAFLKESVF
jgi:hypothetical protein